MARYLAQEAIYLCASGQYVPAGEEFETDITPPAPCWQPLDDAAQAAVDALNAPAVEAQADPEIVKKAAKPTT